MAPRIGKKFSNSTVVDSTLTGVSPSGTRKYRFTLKCTCGNTYTLSGKALGRAIEPCEMCRPVQARDDSSPYRHPLYGSWEATHNRCSNPNDPSYKNYGGRGITVCPQWTGESAVPGAKKSIGGFKQFISDMGPRPEGHSLDRIDNDGNYTPDNCKWSTQKEQASNRRDNVWVTLDGETKLFTHWCTQAGLDPRYMAEKMRGTTRTHEYILNRYWIKVGDTRKRFHEWAVYFGTDPIKLWQFVDNSGLAVWEALTLVSERVHPTK